MYRSSSPQARVSRHLFASLSLLLGFSAHAGATCTPDADVFADGFESGAACRWSQSEGGVPCATYAVDFCRLQFPLVINAVEGTAVTVFGRLYIAGLTDQSGGNDPAPQVSAYVGYGPDGTDPAAGACWVWAPASPNPGYGPPSPGYESNNDEYQASLSIPSPPGQYDFAYRFSGNSGVSFTFCDGGNGSSDGYSPAEAGQLTSEPAPPFSASSQRP